MINKTITINPKKGGHLFHWKCLFSGFSCVFVLKDRSLIILGN